MRGRRADFGFRRRAVPEIVGAALRRDKPILPGPTGSEHSTFNRLESGLSADGADGRRWTKPPRLENLRASATSADEGFGPTDERRGAPVPSGGAEEMRKTIAPPREELLLHGMDRRTGHRRPKIQSASADPTCRRHSKRACSTGVLCRLLRHRTLRVRLVFIRVESQTNRSKSAAPTATEVAETDIAALRHDHRSSPS